MCAVCWLCRDAGVYGLETAANAWSWVHLRPVPPPLGRDMCSALAVTASASRENVIYPYRYTRFGCCRLLSRLSPSAPPRLRTCERLRGKKGEIKGVGAKTIAKIKEFLDTGKIQELVRGSSPRVGFQISSIFFFGLVVFLLWLALAV